MNPVLQRGLRSVGERSEPERRKPRCKDHNILLFFQYVKGRFTLFTQCHLAQI